MQRYLLTIANNQLITFVNVDQFTIIAGTGRLHTLIRKEARSLNFGKKLT